MSSWKFYKRETLKYLTIQTKVTVTSYNSDSSHCHSLQLRHTYEKNNIFQYEPFHKSVNAMKQFCYQKRPIFISTGPLTSDKTALLRRQYINHELLKLNANAINNHLGRGGGGGGGEGREGNVLFNDALNTFYLRVFYMASDIW